jgi:hypothetical protein
MLPGSDPSPREGYNRDAKGDNECGDRNLEVTDVVEESWIRGPDLLGSTADVFRSKPQLNKTCEVADEEHHAIPYEAYAGESDELGAQIQRRA